MVIGRVVKLDRGFPLVRTTDGIEYRCKHATALVKEEKVRAVIGDRVELSIPETHDKALIEEILPRTNKLVRKDPTEQALPQVLAANFERIFVVQPLSEVNFRRLERELVLAYESGAQVAVILTKADLAEDTVEVQQEIKQVQELAGEDEVLVISTEEPESIEAVRQMIPCGETAVLIGKSGVGKSSLINLLVGDEVQATAAVREGDGKGRHTTVSREIVKIPGGGCVIDMPGVRGLGLWDAEAGIETAFSDIEALGQSCKFRDCKHEQEPGCAVQAAVEAEELSQVRLDSYHALKGETEEIQERREEAHRLRTRTGHPRRRSPGK